MSNAFNVAATVSSTLSMVGSLAVLWSYWSQPKSVRKGLGERLVMILSYLDFGASLAFSFGAAFVPKEGADPSGACLFQAWVIQFMVASVCWNAVIAANFYALVVLQMEAKKLRRWLRWEIAGLVAGSAVLSSSLLGAGVFGDAALWCWVASTEPGAQLGGFYTFVVLSWGACIYVLVAIDRHASGGAAAAGAAGKPLRRGLGGTEWAREVSVGLGNRGS